MDRECRTDFFPTLLVLFSGSEPQFLKQFAVIEHIFHCISHFIAVKRIRIELFLIAGKISVLIDLHVEVQLNVALMWFFSKVASWP